MGPKHTLIILFLLFFSFLGKAEEMDSYVSRFQLVPQLSILSPGEITLKNSSFEVPYSKKLQGIFGFSLGAESPLQISDSFQLFFVSRLGFAYTNGDYTVNNTTTRSTNYTNINLAWVPASIGVKSVFSINKFPYVRPTLSVGSGASWMYQSSATDGLSEHFLVPHYYITSGLSFFEKQNPDDWFGGFSFGVTFQDSFATSQRVRNTSFDLSINIIP